MAFIDCMVLGLWDYVLLVRVGVGGFYGFSGLLIVGIYAIRFDAMRRLVCWTFLGECFKCMCIGFFLCVSLGFLFASLGFLMYDRMNCDDLDVYVIFPKFLGFCL